jgi:hypothetical protein
MRELVIESIMDVFENAGDLISQKGMLLILNVPSVPECDIDYVRAALEAASDQEILDVYELQHTRPSEWAFMFGSAFDELMVELDEQQARWDQFRKELKLI